MRVMSETYTFWTDEDGVQGPLTASVAEDMTGGPRFDAKSPPALTQQSPGRMNGAICPPGPFESVRPGRRIAAGRHDRRRDPHMARAFDARWRFHCTGARKTGAGDALQPNRRVARGQARKSPWPNAASAARRCRPNRNARVARSTPRRSLCQRTVDAAWASAKGSETAGGERQRRNPPRRCGAGNYRASCHSSVCKVSADFLNRAPPDWLTLFSTGVGGELPNGVLCRQPEPRRQPPSRGHGARQNGRRAPACATAPRRSPAAPMPVPMHIVTMPSASALCGVACRARWSRYGIAPVAPSGCPSAIAPPSGLTLKGPVPNRRSPPATARRRLR